MRPVPASAGAPARWQKAPELSTPGTNGKPLVLGDLLSTQMCRVGFFFDRGFW